MPFGPTVETVGHPDAVAERSERGIVRTRTKYPNECPALSNVRSNIRTGCPAFSNAGCNTRLGCPALSNVRSNIRTGCPAFSNAGCNTRLACPAFSNVRSNMRTGCPAFSSAGFRHDRGPTVFPMANLIDVQPPGPRLGGRLRWHFTSQRARLTASGPGLCGRESRFSSGLRLRWPGTRARAASACRGHRLVILGCDGWEWWPTVAATFLC
jgi:glutaredoxin-related protein